ncbi:hypothetical protein BHE74_00046306 [Ensete ventricosum]|nr:hypothetical protein BHE74_00046306 [Ensete ventricosum]
MGRDSDGAVGNSPGMCRKLAEGIESLPRWRKGVRQKKTETRRKIIKGSRKACLELGRFIKGIGKLAWNMTGDRWRKTMRLAAGDFEVNIRFKRKFEKWREPLLRDSMGKPLVSGDCTVIGFRAVVSD